MNSTSSGVTTFSATAVTNNGGNWLTVSPSLSTTGSTLTVAVNPATLSAGTYFGSIALNPPGTAGLVVPVNVTVSAPSTLTATPTQLSFAYQIGTSSPAAQTVTLTSNSTTPISFSANATASSCGGNWLVVSPQTSATPSTLSVQINPSGLQAGTCSGTIAISSPGASNQTQSIPVSLLVSTNPLLLVPTSGVTFNYQVGTATPTSQTVQVTSSGAALNFTVAASPLGNAPNFLTISPTSGATPQALTLAINPTVLSNLAPNTYAENVTLTSTGSGNPAQSFTVTLVVGNTPTLVTSQQNVTFNYQIGQSAPANQVLTVTSTGAPLQYAVTSTTSNCNGFLTATPASATTSYLPGAQASQIVLAASTTGLTTPQTCNGTVTLTVPGSAAAPITIPVTLNVSSTPLLVVSPGAINVLALAGGTPTQTTVSLTSTDQTTALPFAATASTNPAGLTWLSVAPNSGTVPASLSVIVNPNLPPGIYSGSINISSSAAGTMPATIPVNLIIASATVATTTTSLTFNQATGGALPGAQTIQVSGVPMGATIGATASLFNVSNAFTVSTSGNSLTITPAATSLATGTYAGVVTVFVPGAINNPLYIPITYTVGGTSAPTFNFTPSTLSFNYQSGGTLPAAQNVQLTSATTGTNISFAAVAATAPGTTGGTVFATVTPSSGTTPGTLSISLLQSAVTSLAPGTYSNVINLTSTSTGGVAQSIPITLTVTAGTTPTVAAVVSGASFLSGAVSPGEIVSIFGTNVGPVSPLGLMLTAAGNVATTLGTTSVTFNGVSAPLIFVSANQINAIVPYEVASSNTATVVVTNNGFNSATFQVNIAATAPGIFVAGENGTGQGAILNSDSSANTATNAAARGSAISIFATGEGVLNPAATTGSLTAATGTSFPKPVANVTVTIGGTSAQVTYAGEAPGLVSGVLQVNAVIPAGIATGPQPVVLTVGNVSTTANVTVAVK
ncbi:MAG: hypothetical protein JO022_01545 [Acidobacteriaceae bacterium]|nr:hypothetical protein [Acidobacteriaceae bacterium]